MHPYRIQCDGNCEAVVGAYLEQLQGTNRQKKPTSKGNLCDWRLPNSAEVLKYAIEIHITDLFGSTALKKQIASSICQSSAEEGENLLDEYPELRVGPTLREVVERRLPRVRLYGISHHHIPKRMSPWSQLPIATHAQFYELCRAMSTKLSLFENLVCRFADVTHVGSVSRIFGCAVCIWRSPRCPASTLR